MASKFKIIAETDNTFSLYEGDLCMEKGFETLEEAQAAQDQLEEADHEGAVVDHAIDLALDYIMQECGHDRDQAMRSLKEMLRG